MSKRRYVIAALAALGLVAAACSSSDKGSSSTEATTGVTAGDTSAATTGGSAAGATDTVEATQGQDLTFYMITHGDDGVVLVRRAEGRRAGRQGPRRHGEVRGLRTTTPRSSRR